MSYNKLLYKSPKNEEGKSKTVDENITKNRKESDIEEEGTECSEIKNDELDIGNLETSVSVNDNVAEVKTENGMKNEVTDITEISSADVLVDTDSDSNQGDVMSVNDKINIANKYLEKYFSVKSMMEDVLKMSSVHKRMGSITESEELPVEENNQSQKHCEQKSQDIRSEEEIANASENNLVDICKENLESPNIPSISNFEEGIGNQIKNRNISIPWNVKLKCLWKKNDSKIDIKVLFIF